MIPNREPCPKAVTATTTMTPHMKTQVDAVARYHPHIYEQRFVYTSTSAAAAMAVGRTNTLGGSGDQIYLDSASTKDILAGSAVTTCKVWFLKTTGQTVIKEVGMGGTSATTVDTSAMQYCDHWATGWGGLYDAEGNILLVGSGETFGTISATHNETINATFWISKYWRAKPVHLKITNGAQATSGALLDAGVITYPVYYSPGVEEDQDIRTYESYCPAAGGANPNTYETNEPWGSPIYGNDSTASRIQVFQGILVTDEAAETYNFQIDWLLWCTNRSNSWAIQES